MLSAQYGRPLALRILRRLRQRWPLGRAVSSGAMVLSDVAAAEGFPEAQHGAAVSQALLQERAEDHAHWIAMAHQRREQLTAPYQSGFRVFSLIICEDGEGKLRLLEGANAESGFIYNSLCAERSALVQLQKLPHPVEVRSIYVVTDSDKAMSPGVLCREWLLSRAKPETPIVLAGTEGPHVVIPLGDMLPHPFIYRYMDTTAAMKFAQALSLNMQLPSLELLERATQASSAARTHAALEHAKEHGWLRAPADSNRSVENLYTLAAEACAHDIMDHVHPLRFGAAALFADGSVETSWSLKALEYGGTIDACSAFMVALDKRVRAREDDLQAEPGMLPEATQPVLLVQVDQFGVMHAPSARARGLLVEFGHENILVLAHDEEGRVQCTTSSDLVPVGPHMMSGGDLYEEGHSPSVDKLLSDDCSCP